MLIWRLGAVAAVWVGAQTALAQSQITPDAFMDRAVGRTLTFESVRDGRTVGVEQFLSRRQTVWTRRDGSCTYGQVTLTDDMVCFTYEDQWNVEHCWFPHEQDGTLIVKSLRGSVQRVSRITDLPVVCYDAPVS
tara:strand:+ start:274 stop:675 length:402 start_codon:yes stop_codon:yes gene_type:complete